MPYFFFFVWNHQENYLFFTGWVMIWNISWKYFFFFGIQSIKSNCCIIFLKRFPIIYFWRIIYLSQLYLFINGLIYETLSVCDADSSKFNATVAAHWKHLSSSFFGFVVLFYHIWRINIWTIMFKVYLMTIVIP